MEATTLALLLLVILVTAFFVLSKKTNLPPGPWTPIPYIGFAPNVAYALYKGEKLYQFLMKLGEKHGSIFSFIAFGIPVVVLSDYHAIREAFQDTKLSDKGKNEMQAKVFSKSFNRWADIGPFRAFALACFRKFGVGTTRFEEPIANESKYLIEELVNLKGEPVDLTWHLNSAVANVICKMMFGARFELSDKRIHRLTYLLNRQNELAGSGGIEIFVPINLPSKEKEEMSTNADELLNFINNIIDEHRKNFDPDNLNDVIDMWLNEIRLHKSDDPNSYLNPANMPGLIFLMFLAGTDTTSNTLRWATQYLVRYPKIQERIHLEIDDVVGRDRLPKIADKLNLPYTRAAIAELHRIVSLAPLSNFHVAGETTTLRGYTIPKNAVQLVCRDARP